MASFETTREEFLTIARIADRAGLEPEQRRDLMMDLAACHANGTPMDFERLLAADGFNFWHDVGGIARHLDRGTGQLANHFLPRFAQKRVQPSASEAA